MIQDELVYQILQDFGFEPTQDQRNALHIFARFMTDRSENAAMILRGSAGTGKTSLAGAIVRAVNRLRIKVSLLAPTGRAAKVFSLNAGLAASTIHRKIYREKAFNGADGQFQLNNNMFRDMLFMVDEASMISLSQSNTTFGSGRLLDDLVQYVYSSGANCRLLLIGDKAQLPPVGEQESPALRADVLKAYSLQVYECDLNEVLRQSQHSGILWNATAIREMITYNTATQLPQIHLKGFADISIVQGNELIESLASSYSAVGMDETMVITRSNKRANIFNQGIRNTILGREEELTTGDLVMVVKNKYLEKDRSTDISFIANGDHAVVRRVRNIRELYGFRFADVALEFPDYNNTELDTVVVLDTLTTEAPALTHEQNDKLFQSVMEDYADVPRKADRMKQLREDEYFNAMQIKFGYAVTCHKAQGGQWAHIYLDQGYMTDEMLTPDYIHWLYTAFTRATEHLYLVNWSKKQTAEYWKLQ
ncbi:ATP-dependent DNA helicase [Prevotella intermedia]|uniref:ATP-dependent exodeoxyribonuclease n=1 Tax=Prevotella intermedia TaxID=28131 RepID=A0A0S3UIW6_PREIN|nr:AAA family ATPase [Prevotella intermedia]AWX07460.1 ATP-dependent endonuclease [Prevotella intermedia]BAU17453.1 ATP-dependent exodeoxyribonuclease [Prevotella intermedia]